MGSLAGVFLSVHTPRYCTLEAAFEGKLASEVFRPVRDGLVAQGGDVAEARLDVMAINSCHLISTFPTVVDGTPRHQGVLTAQEAPEIIHGWRTTIPATMLSPPPSSRAASPRTTWPSSPTTCTIRSTTAP